MTNPPIQTPSTAQAPRIPMPGIGTGLLLTAPLLLLIGGLIYMGTAYSGFNPELFQTKLGTGVFLCGALFVVVGIILAGVRSIAQQVVNVLFQAGRD